VQQQPSPPLLLSASAMQPALLLLLLVGRRERLMQNRQLHSSLQHWLNPTCRWYKGNASKTSSSSSWCGVYWCCFGGFAHARAPDSCVSAVRHLHNSQQ
jgi:hypothetical protein